MKLLDGKTAVVTGANSGMGMASAAALADMGAAVLMLCRSEARGKAALEKLREEPGRKLELVLCDLGDYASIHHCADRITASCAGIDILVNNAGFISLDRQETADGLERQFGVNHIGHFLLTMRLLPLMHEGGRIVNVASGAHKVGKIHFNDIHLQHGFHVVKAYSQSKLANVLFTRELADRLRNHGITVNCCHPGAVATNMGVSRDTGFGKTITGMLKPFFQTPAEGASTAIFLASDPSVSGVTGEYFYRCNIAPSSRRSQDRELSRKLFRLSEELTGVPFDEEQIGKIYSCRHKSE